MPHRREWSRRYPPLVGALLAGLLSVFVLPSALNVPQSNPTQTLEFAPVPPQDEDEPPPPDSGNVANLGLGSSSTAPSADVSGGEGPGLPPPPPLPEGEGARPVTKRCVGNPPRQTEDPMAPPCVAHFEGDNGGATYQGVEAGLVTVVLYRSPAVYVQATGNSHDDETQYRGEYFDLSQPPQDEEPLTVRQMRVFQRYFNQRYQTYGRFVRFIVHFGSTSPPTPESRRADAIEAHQKWKPFAALTSLQWNGLTEPYIQELAARGVLMLGMREAQPESFYRRYPGRIWSFWPSVERIIENNVAFYCSRVAGHPVVDSGHEEWNGRERVYGYLYTTDESLAAQRQIAAQLRPRLEECGFTFAADGTFPYGNRHTNAFTGDPGLYARENMSRFQQEGVTTIVWAGGIESEHGKAARELNYYPEVIGVGDRLFDGSANGFHQASEFFEHAWTVTSSPLVPEDEDEDECRRAMAEADPNYKRDGGPIYSANFCPAFPDFRQLFTGIQVAGPNLTPETMDQGFHAIPSKASTGPKVAACFYDPGDYTCVKDVALEYWDLGDSDDTDDDCWRMSGRGERFLLEDWSTVNIDARVTADDPCNAFGGAQAGL